MTPAAAWLARGAPLPDAFWRDLEHILKERTGRTIRFEKRTIDRECVVVRGRLALAPLDAQHDDGAVYVPVGLAGDANVAVFLRALSVGTGCAFVDETESSSEHLRWKVQPGGLERALSHRASVATAPGDMQVIERALIDPMLADLARQTSLEFRKEKRPAEVVVAVEGNK
jgi:hypothetical protein